MKEPSKQNVRDFINARSPLISFLISWFFLGLTFILYSLHVGESEHILDPDVEVDWNSILSETNKLQACLSNKKYTLPSQVSTIQIKTNSDLSEYQEIDTNITQYYVVSLGVIAEYQPTENYIEGDYHEQSQRDDKENPMYTNTFGQAVKPDVLGIFPSERPKHADVWYGDESIFMTYDFGETRYNSNENCYHESKKDENKYHFDSKNYTVTKCRKQKVFSCVSYFIPYEMYLNTPSLRFAALPTHTSSEANKDDPLTEDSTTMCDRPDAENIQTAVFSSIEKNQPCNSYLFAHTIHKEDPSLMKILDDESRDRVFHRVFYSGLLLCLCCVAFLIWGAFRGSNSIGQHNASYFPRRSDNNLLMETSSATIDY